MGAVLSEGKVESEGKKERERYALALKLGNILVVDCLLFIERVRGWPDSAQGGSQSIRSSERFVGGTEACKIWEYCNIWSIVLQ